MIISGVNLVMTVIGFAVSTMFIVFVCTRLICARIQLNATRRSYQVPTRPDYSLPERRLHGLDPRAVASFPTKKYSDESLPSEEAQCPVCLAEYNSEDTLRVLPSCGHFFHVTCIDQWLHQRSTCPVCRISLREFANRNNTSMISSGTRSNDGSEPPAYNSPHSPSASPSHSSATQDENRAEAFQENQYANETALGVEGGEIITIIIEKIPATKDSANKLVESPSCT